MYASSSWRACRTAHDSFSSCVLSDLGKVVGFAGKRAILSDVEMGQLLDALNQLKAIAFVAPPEMYHSYFNSLNILRRGANYSEIRRTLLQVGNALVEPCLRNKIAVRLPIAVKRNGWFKLPGMRADGFIKMGSTTTTITTDCLLQIPREILRLEDESWMARCDAIRLRGPTEPILTEIERYREEACRIQSADDISPSKPNLEVISTATDSGRIIATKYCEAANLIRRVDNESYRELQILTKFVVPLEGNSKFIGGSALSLYGATFLKLQSTWSPLCFADHLIHEAAHQLLHAVQELQPLILNREQYGAQSPIRSDPRPLYGIFHATFVFLRLSEFMSKALNVLTAPEEKREAELRLNRHLLGLLQGLDTILEHGEFSHYGDIEVEEWVSHAISLCDHHGTPDASLVSALNWDYERAPILTIPRRFKTHRASPAIK